MSYVAKQQTKYLAHMARQETSSTAKKLLFNDNKNVKKGRPAIAMEQQVLQHTGLTADQFYRNALKREFNKDMVDCDRSFNCSTSVTADRS